MLGSLADAEDAVQNTWLRVSCVDARQIDNLGAWLTTVVGRECLHMLRSRRRRREDSFSVCLPDLIVIPDDDLDPEQQAVQASSVSMALLIVLDQLSPLERVCFVLHDMFDFPFDDVAAIADRTPAAARQLASRARRRVRAANVESPEPDPARQRQVVRAFYAAAWTRDFEALLKVLNPDIVLRTDFGAERPPTLVRGAAEVARQSRAPRGGQLRPALVNGAIGTVIFHNGRPFSIMTFTVSSDKIVRIDIFRDPRIVTRLPDALLGQSG